MGRGDGMDRPDLAPPLCVGGEVTRTLFSWPGGLRRLRAVDARDRDDALPGRRRRAGLGRGGPLVPAGGRAGRVWLHVLARRVPPRGRGAREMHPRRDLRRTSRATPPHVASQTARPGPRLTPSRPPPSLHRAQSKTRRRRSAGSRRLVSSATAAPARASSPRALAACRRASTSGWRRSRWLQAAGSAGEAAPSRACTAGPLRSESSVEGPWCMHGRVPRRM